MELLQLTALDVLMTILPRFLHVRISYCKSSLNVGKPWKFKLDLVAYLMRKSLENRMEESTLAARNVFMTCFTPIPPLYEILI